MKSKPMVGQILFRLNTGNRAISGQGLTKVAVTKVGRKYFTCVENGFSLGTEYYIDGWKEKTNYSVNFVLYKSKQEWEEEKESSLICKEICSSFEYGRNIMNVPLEKLRLILDIIGGNNET